MRGTELMKQTEVEILKAMSHTYSLHYCFHWFQIVVSSTVCWLEDMQMIPWQCYTWFSTSHSVARVVWSYNSIKHYHSIQCYKACKKNPCFEYLGSSKQHTEKFPDYLFLYDQVRLCKSCTCDTGKSCFLK